MKGNRRNRMKRAAARRGEAIVAPTRQTARRLRPDAVRRLFNTGRIDNHHAMAAEQIRAVCEATGRGLVAAIRPDMVAAAPNRCFGRDFLDRMTERERDLWLHCYLPWKSRMEAMRKSGLAGLRQVQLVIDVVVENRTLREVELEYGLKRGRGFHQLVFGLEEYACVARLT